MPKPSIRNLSLVTACLLVAVVVGCHIDTSNTTRSTTRNPQADVAPTAPRAPVGTTAPAGPVVAEQPGRERLPALTSEPLIGVLLATGPQVAVILARPGWFEAQGRRVPVPAGTLRVEAGSTGLRTDLTGKTVLGYDLVIHVTPVAGQETFSALLMPPNGKAQKLSFSGQPEVHLDRASRKAQLVERVGMETYLAGVLVTEVNPAWPLEALKAQAVVARSYAADRYLQNIAAPWQLHWHYTVDMAYGGLKTLSPRVATVLAQTRGDLLTYKGLPVPTLFHACSGGKTESAQHFRPDLKGADGVTDMTVVMPVVEDPEGIVGAEGLGMTATHLAWRAELSLTKVSASLKEWAANHPQDRLAFGSVVAVRPFSRFPDSGRVAEVTIRHLLGRHETDTRMPATDFRLAVGPGIVRSTNWTRCVVAAADGGTLVVEGRGYGHGVGMSQVSAWQLARVGQGADDILKRFYPGAALTKSW